ncbi:MAG: Ig domain-containing protein [Candidatus Korobacteraceae bacterium]
MRIRTVVPITLFWFLNCLAVGQTLQIGAIPTQGVIVGQSYTLPLTATGGTAPFTWQLAGGELPPGLRLLPHTGRISGSATTAGEYRFTIVVNDSSIPKLQAQRDFTINVIAGLAIDWKEAPKVHGNTIAGSAVVTNETGRKFDLTVVIVAVNEIGRATTLGYQHFTLAAQSTSQVIPFSSSPGLGTYYVRADAVAHHTGHQHIFRASKQTPATIKVAQL